MSNSISEDAAATSVDVLAGSEVVTPQQKARRSSSTSTSGSGTSQARALTPMAVESGFLRLGF